MSPGKGSMEVQNVVVRSKGPNLCKYQKDIYALESVGFGKFSNHRSKFEARAPLNTYVTTKTVLIIVM